MGHNGFFPVVTAKRAPPNGPHDNGSSEVLVETPVAPLIALIPATNVLANRFPDFSEGGGGGNRLKIFFCLFFIFFFLCGLITNVYKNFSC